MLFLCMSLLMYNSYMICISFTHFFFVRDIPFGIYKNLLFFDENLLEEEKKFFFFSVTGFLAKLHKRSTLPNNSCQKFQKHKGDIEICVKCRRFDQHRFASSAISDTLAREERKFFSSKNMNF